MLEDSLLAPIASETREKISLDGIWRFCFDPKGEGEARGWPGTGLPEAIPMPVPGSFADLFTDCASRDYCGDFWYETEFFLPQNAQGRELYLRFGSVTHRCKVFVNGTPVGEHEGGFLPVVCQITGAAREGANRLVVLGNNEVNETSLPCGQVTLLPDGRKLAKPYFDFFNYAGIQRSVYLLTLPPEHIRDYSLRFELEGEDALVRYSVDTSGSHPVYAALYDAQGNLAAESQGKTGELHVKKAKLWQVGAPYLYTLELRIREGERTLDLYRAQVGIRTVSLDSRGLRVNGNPVYLKGFGKHEDFELLGRSFNPSIAIRDMECMKWSGANCFRTSHYPYAEEWYDLADQYGFLILDEVPAVGMMRSIANFLDAASGQNTSFFEGEQVETLRENHLRQIEAMIARDKNHPSVVAWSLFNEPETTSQAARDYFAEIFRRARPLDPQSRPLTGALMMSSRPENCQCWDLLDFVCLNRYYGWYTQGGAELEAARLACLQEMEQWEAKQVPVIFTEFGADTLASEHKLPEVMWSQEYQNSYLKMMGEIFDRFDFIRGELVWNFADFQTSQGIMRVNGNNKGVFTRLRQPKAAAWFLRERWGKV